MKLALTQMPICWEAPEKNQIICRRLTKTASQNQCDWIIFPELTLTGFTMQPEIFEPAIGESDATEGILGHTFFQQLSHEFHIGIVYGSILIQPQTNALAHYNCMEFLQNGSSILRYSKIHPFTYGEEALHYQGGSEIRIGSDCISNTCLSGFICYDLRFPEVFQLASKDASVIFLIANWPEVRIAHWYALLQARAIENQCFIIGVNRTGDGNGLHYCPSSVAYDPYGTRLTSASDSELIYTQIDPNLAEHYRSEFPVRADRKFMIQNPTSL